MTHEVHVVGRATGATAQSIARAELEAFYAVCSCGWRGLTVATRTAAERDGDEHQIQMARAGEGVND